MIFRRYLPTTDWVPIKSRPSCPLLRNAKIKVTTTIYYNCIENADGDGYNHYLYRRNDKDINNNIWINVQLKGEEEEEEAGDYWVIFHLGTQCRLLLSVGGSDHDEINVFTCQTIRKRREINNTGWLDPIPFLWSRKRKASSIARLRFGRSLNHFWQVHFTSFVTGKSWYWISRVPNREIAMVG